MAESGAVSNFWHEENPENILKTFWYQDEAENPTLGGDAASDSGGNGVDWGPEDPHRPEF